MQENEQGRGGFRKKWFNKKALLVLVIAVVVIAAGGGMYLVKASDNPAFCTTCHIMEPYYDSWHDSSLLAKQHAEADVKCHDCHEATIGTQAQEGLAFITGNYTIPLEKLEVSRDFCLECHDDFDTAVKEATDFEESNPHDSHNGKMECNACHSMHQPSEVMCSECHIFNWFDDLDESWVTQ